MDSPATLSGSAQIVPKQCDNNIFLAKKKSQSSSSSSSLSSCSFSIGSLYFPDESPLSPATPLKFSGVPFSWETLPGIPKENILKKKESLLKELPPPPTPTSMPMPPSSRKEEFGTRKKVSSEKNFRKDPFIAALVECSKDDDNDNDNEDYIRDSRAKITRSISDRFGFINLYISCKKTCAVSDSSVYLPRTARTSYDLIHHHSRRRR